MSIICPDCKGEKVIEKPISFSEKAFVPCETCEGTGFIPDTFETKIITRLDRIIVLLEKKQ
jgi:excinuclease UvrABC ATPase subunit